MSYSESLAGRIRDDITRERLRNITEKRMFGGVGFMLNGNMLVGVWKDSLIVRLGLEQAAAALLQQYVRQMDITGKPMKGWIIVDPDGMESDEQLRNWIHQAVAFVSALPKK